MTEPEDISFDKSCLVDFIAHRDLIAKKLGEGYSMMAVWKALSAVGRIKMTYSYFARLCRSQLSRDKKNPASPAPAPRPVASSDQDTAKSAIYNPPKERKKFSWDSNIIGHEFT